MSLKFAMAEFNVSNVNCVVVVGMMNFILKDNLK